MLINLKQKFKPLALILLGLIAVAFVLGGYSQFQSNQNTQSNSLAKVGDISLSAEEWTRIIENNKQSAATKPAAELWQSWQSYAVWLELARAAKLQVPKSAVMHSLMSIPAFQKDGQFNIDQAQKILSKQQLSLEQLMSELQKNQTAEMVAGILNISLMMPNNWDDLIHLIATQKRSGQWVKVHGQLAPSPKLYQLQQFYRKHSQMFASEPLWHLAYVAIPVDAVAVNKPDLKQITAWYQQHKKDYTQAEVWDLVVWHSAKLKASLDQLQSAVAKAELLSAKQKSSVKALGPSKKISNTQKLTDKEQSQNWPEQWTSQKIGIMSSQYLPADWQKKLQNLHQPGWSKPFVAEKKLISLQVKSYQPAHLLPLDKKLQHSISLQLQQQQRQKQAMVLMRPYYELAAKRHTAWSKSAWQQALQKMGAAADKSVRNQSELKLTKKQLADDPLLSQPELKKMLQQMANNQSSNNWPVLLKSPQPTWVLLVGLGYQPAKIPEFSKIKSLVHDKWLAEQQFMLDEQALQQLMDHPKQQNKLNWQHFVDKSLQDWPKSWPAAVAEKLFAISKQQNITPVVAPGQGVYLVQLDKITLPKWQPQSQQFMIPIISSGWGRDLLDQAVKNWLQEFKVTSDKQRLGLEPHANK